MLRPNTYYVRKDTYRHTYEIYSYTSVSNPYRKYRNAYFLPPPVDAYRRKLLYTMNLMQTLQFKIYTLK